MRIAEPEAVQIVSHPGWVGFSRFEVFFNQPAVCVTFRASGGRLRRVGNHALAGEQWAAVVTQEPGPDCQRGVGLCQLVIAASLGSDRIVSRAGCRNRPRSRPGSTWPGPVRPRPRPLGILGEIGCRSSARLSTRSTWRFSSQPPGLGHLPPPEVIWSLDIPQIKPGRVAVHQALERDDQVSFVPIAAELNRITQVKLVQSRHVIVDDRTVDLLLFPGYPILARDTGIQKDADGKKYDAGYTTVELRIKVQLEQKAQILPKPLQSPVLAMYTVSHGISVSDPTWRADGVVPSNSGNQARCRVQRNRVPQGFTVTLISIEPVLSSWHTHTNDLVVASWGARQGWHISPACGGASPIDFNHHIRFGKDRP